MLGTLARHNQGLQISTCHMVGQCCSTCNVCYLDSLYCCVGAMHVRSDRIGHVKNVFGASVCVGVDRASSIAVVSWMAIVALQLAVMICWWLGWHCDMLAGVYFGCGSCWSETMTGLAGLCCSCGC